MSLCHNELRYLWHAWRFKIGSNIYVYRKHHNFFDYHFLTLGWQIFFQFRSSGRQGHMCIIIHIPVSIIVKVQQAPKLSGETDSLCNPYTISVVQLLASIWKNGRLTDLDRSTITHMWYWCSAHRSWEKMSGMLQTIFSGAILWMKFIVPWFVTQISIHNESAMTRAMSPISWQHTSWTHSDQGAWRRLAINVENLLKIA